MSEATHTPTPGDKSAATTATPNGAGTAAAPPSPAVVPAPVSTTPEPVVNTAKVPTRKLVEDADSEIPGDADLLEFKPSAFKARLERHAQSHLKKELGVESMETLREKLAKAEEYERKQEEQRLANLSEVERLNERAMKAEQERDAIRMQYQTEKEQQELREVEGEIRDIGMKFVSPKYLKYATNDLRETLARTPSEQYEKDPEAFVRGWFEKYAEENPQLAIQVAAPTPPAPSVQQPPQLVVGITNGPNAPPPGSRTDTMAEKKTPMPGMPNSMTEAEWREYKRARGLV